MVFALRLLATVWAVQMASTFTFRILQHHIWTRFRDGDFSDDLMDRAILVGEVAAWSWLALVALALVGVGLLVRAVPRGRGRVLAWCSLGLMGAHFGLDAFSAMWSLTGEPLPMSEVLGNGLWLTQNAALHGGLFLALAAAIHRMPASRPVGGIVLGVFAAFAACHLVGSAYALFAEQRSWSMVWVTWSMLVATGVSFVVIAYWVAAKLARAELRGVLETAVGGTLRLLAWSTLLRVALAILGAVLLMVFSAKQYFGAAQTTVLASTILGIATALLVGAALVLIARTPSVMHSGTALGYALAALVLGAVLDILAAKASIELFGIAESASGATSFWAMPSLSEAKRLTLMLRWGGRGGLVLGVSALLCITYSLRVTAESLHRDDRAAHADRVIALVGLAGGWALIWNFAAGSLRGRWLLIVVATSLLALAIAALVAWLRLVFLLARDVDVHSAPARPDPWTAPAPAPTTSHQEGEAHGG